MAKFYRLPPNYSNRSISRHQIDGHGKIGNNTSDGGEPPMDHDYATKDELRELSNKMDQRFSEVDRRFDQIDKRLEELNKNMDIRFDTLSKLIWWQIGLFPTLVILPAFIAFMRFVLTYHF